MILKFEEEEDEIFLLDAYYHSGVSIQRWSILRNFLIGNQKEGIKQFYDQIVYRRLIGEREDSLVDKLEILLREVVGRSYGLSTSKLFFQRHTVAKKAKSMPSPSRNENACED